MKKLRLVDKIGIGLGILIVVLVIVGILSNL